MSSDKITQAESAIKTDVQNHKGLQNIHDDINSTLRAADTVNGKLNHCQFRQDLKDLTAQMHQDGILPKVDIVMNGSSDTALRGVSGDGTADGQGNLVSRAHGDTFKYNSDGYVTKFTENHGKNVFTYDKQTGMYAESINGVKQKNEVNEVVSVDEHGRETVTNADGSTKTTAAWGGTISRDSQGRITEETHGDHIRDFKYNGDRLQSVTDYASAKDQKAGKAEQSYIYDSTTGKYINSDHKQTVDLQLERAGAGSLTVINADGSRQEQHWGGEKTNWNADNQLTSIDYSNGSKASDFTYGTDGNISGYKFTQRGPNHQFSDHEYKTDNGQLTLDGKPVQGTLSADNRGVITLTDSSGPNAHTVTYGLGGTEVDRVGENVTRVRNWGGKTETFGYDGSNLSSVHAYGFDLSMRNGQWVDNNTDKPVDFTPTLDSNGRLTVTKQDGTFESYTASGVRTIGVSELQPGTCGETKVPDAAAFPNNDQTQAPSGSDSQSSGNNGQPADSSANAGGNDGTQLPPHKPVLGFKGVPFNTGMSIDTDGVGNHHGDATAQNDTSYADGHLNADKTNYVALAPGWAQAHGLQLGDVVAVKHDGKTAYAIYGDNYTGNAVHGEGSYRLAQELGIDSNPNTGGAGGGVEYIAFPGSRELTNGSIDQKTIDAVGKELYA